MKLATRHPDLGTLLPIHQAPDDGPLAGGHAPEDRLAILERDFGKVTAELAAAKAEAAALKGAVEAAKAIEAKRRTAEIEGYLLGLKQQAAPNAITEPDLARVRALMDRGDDDTAKFLGDLLLKGTQPAAQGTHVTFGPTAHGGQEAAKRGAAELLSHIPDKQPHARRRG